MSWKDGTEDECYERCLKEQKSGASMSADAQIKTGLRLSEAMKLIEENEGAMIKCHQYPGDDFLNPYYAALTFQRDTTWDVKLPPPKTVSVTRLDLEKAFHTMRKQNYCVDASLVTDFCKELGL